jgi:hypothetical protein
MRLLVLDHFFQHDLDALRAAAGRDVEFRVIPYELLRTEALRMLPPDVASGLIAFAKPEYEEHRARYYAWLRGMFEELYMRHEFDAFLSPSDTFFYVRGATDACHALGVPFIVVQRETTISQQTMRDEPPRVLEYAPPQCDHMTVCSERLKQFWINGGMDGERLTITGQPRFDFYKHPERWPEQSPHASGDGPVVLFLSYHLDAYHPDASEGLAKPLWQDLRDQTERGLYELAERGWTVLIKPHPQQELSRERARIQEAAGPRAWRNVQLIPGTADVRRLVVTSDVIAGFQTTTLFEGMMAGRPVIYTGWDPEAEKLSGDLVPFWDWDDAIEVARDADGFARLVERTAATEIDAARMARRSEIVHEQLGPVDGQAGARSLAAIRACVDDFAAKRTPELERKRAELARRRPPLRLERRARHGFARFRRRAGAMLGR